MLRVIVLFGVPGAGKSYLAKRLCAHNGYLNADSDTFASRIYGEGRSINDSFKSAVGLFCDFVKLNNGFNGTFVFTDSVSNFDNLKRLQGLNELPDVELEFWKIDCPLQVAADRLKSRPSGHIDTNSMGDLIAIDKFYQANDLTCRVIDNGATPIGGDTHLHDLVQSPTFIGETFTLSRDSSTR